MLVAVANKKLQIIHQCQKWPRPSQDCKIPVSSSLKTKTTVSRTTSLDSAILYMLPVLRMTGQWGRIKGNIMFSRVCQMAAPVGVGGRVTQLCLLRGKDAIVDCLVGSALW